MSDPNLTELRQRIDTLDAQLVGLLSERAAVAQAVGKAKAGAPVYRPAREAQVLQKVTAANSGPLDGEVLSGIYREIIAACRNLQRPLRVAYLGPEGTYSEEAARKQCGASSAYIPCASIEATILAVEKGEADVAVVPVSNSTTGTVRQAAEPAQRLAVGAELSLPIHHQLLTQAAQLDDIQEVIAHEQSLAQCRKWLTEHLPHAKQTTASSNAAAAMLAQYNPAVAAIASKRAGERYDLPILASNIEDDPANTTRFVVLHKPEATQPETPAALPYICDLAPYQPGLPIEHVARQYGLDPSKIIKLASNENPLGPSPKAVEAIKHAAASINYYPEQHTLLQKLSQHLGVSTDMLALGNGSNDVLDVIGRTYLAPGAEAISSQYAFAMYGIITQTVGARNVVVPAADYGHDLEAMARAITPSTRIVWIANPNNPTGTLVPYAEVKRFLERMPQRVIVVLDEAYYEYLDDAERVDATRWLSKHPNLILVRTFSKIYGLAGLRLGYAIAAPAVAELLNRVRQPFNANNLALAAATAALDDQAHVTKSIEANRRGREQLLLGLRQLDLECLPAHGNFVTCKIPNAAQVNQQLLGQGIIVRPLAGYDMPNWLRITAGTPQENAKLLATLATLTPAAIAEPHPKN